MSTDLSHRALLKSLPKDAQNEIVWNNEGSVLCGTMFAPDKTSAKLPYALIDLDGTIIRPKDGRKLPRPGDATDWEWAFPEVPERLRKLSRKYRIIIVSNQKRMQACWPVKVQMIVRKLDVRLTIFAATSDDQYRKPRTGLRYYFGELPEGSLFCGDAAGRKGDFADTDRKFAINLGIDFYTPEELFQAAKAEPYELKYPVMKKVIKNSSFYLGHLLSGWSETKPTLHVIVGLPGSGKSWYARLFFEARGCRRVNADELGSIPKCIKAASSIMSTKVLEGNNKQIKPHIVVDNTNLNVETRAKWIALAEKHGYRTVCYDMQTDFDICRHNVAYRCVSGGRNVPDHVLRILRSKYKQPTEKEGFAKICQVDFSPIGITKDKLGEYCKYLF